MSLLERVAIGTVLTALALLVILGREAAMIAVLVGGGILLLTWYAVRRPLASLTAAARAIADGNAPIYPESRIAEIDGLVQALRQMARRLAERLGELDRARAGSAAIIDAMDEGVIATDARGRVTTVNRAARDLLEYAEHETLPELRTLFRVKAAREAVDEVLGGSDIDDRELVLDDRIIALHARPLAGGGAVVVLHDLTEVRRLEAVRRDFIANVSHELKTPLTSISGYAETLLAGDLDEGTRQRFLGTIISNSRRMQQLTDDLLDLSRIESGRWVPRPARIALTDAAGEAWRLFADAAEGRKVKFSIDVAAGAEHLTADPDALRQILTNLFDNAMRYVPDGGRITVTGRPAGAMVEIAVTDDGVGIPAEHLPRIFERFYRVDPSRSREAGGTGLGLSIVRHMVESHGGEVGAESTPRIGTTIRFTLPGSDADLQ